FDLALIEGQGGAVLDMSRRADAVYARAVYHLTRALAADPRRRDVYSHLFRLHALADRYDEALPMLSGMAAFFPDDPHTWLYLGTAHHRLGQATEAEAAFQQAMELMTPEARAAFEDITLFLRPEELVAYQTDPETVTRRLWGAADPRFLTPENERRLEHYARLTYADLMYRSDDLLLPGWATQRGKIHVRYGVPTQDVVIVGGFQQVLEAFPERDATFTPAEMQQEANLFEIWDYGDFQFVFEDPGRNGEFRLYSPPADLFATVGAGAAAPLDYEIRARETFRRTPERFTFTPPGRAVQLPYRVTTFLSDDGGTDLYVHYGIPVTGSVAAGPDGTLPIPIRTGAFLIDGERDVLVERRRTLYGLRADQVASFDGVQMWVDTQPLRASPGHYTVSLEFEALGGGASAVQRRDVDAPDYRGSRLALSDAMLAYDVQETGETEIPGLVVRHGLAIRPAPWGVFRADRPIFLYFEVYRLGLEGGQSNYQVEARLVPRDEGGGLAGIARRALGGRRRGVGTEAEARGSSADDAQYVVLDAAGQPPGRYILTLRVRDRVTGQSAERETEVMLE
ncbi:MAG TPA: GWxTD domain-containing protein, partial [Rhodothermales bacterium]|nr:GWxTD domain-containing protein [Rhodothermales bacterium]